MNLEEAKELISKPIRVIIPNPSKWEDLVTNWNHHVSFKEGVGVVKDYWSAELKNSSLN